MPNRQSQRRGQSVDASQIRDEGEVATIYEWQLTSRIVDTWEPFDSPFAAASHRLPQRPGRLFNQLTKSENIDERTIALFVWHSLLPPRAIARNERGREALTTPDPFFSHLISSTSSSRVASRATSTVIWISIARCSFPSVRRGRAGLFLVGLPPTSPGMRSWNGTFRVCAETRGEFIILADERPAWRKEGRNPNLMLPGGPADPMLESRTRTLSVNFCAKALVFGNRKASMSFDVQGFRPRSKKIAPKNPRERQERS